MNPKSILLVGNHLSSVSNNPSVAEGLGQRLVERGWKIILVSRRANKIQRLADMLWTIWSCRQQYTIAQIDVFGGAAFQWAELCTILLSWIDKPYILTLHGGNLPEFSKHHPHRVKRVLSRAALVTAPSGFLKEKMQTYREDIKVIPNMIDTTNYPFRLRRNLKPVFIWLRAYHSIYNPTLAIRVLAMIMADYPNAKLIMAGPDKGDGSLKAAQLTAVELGISKNVEFLGRVSKNEVPNLLSRGDIFLNTTNIDNTPVSMIEAMACGLCIVSTNVGGIPFLLVNSHDGFLVPPDDPLSMTAAVRVLLREPIIASRLSTNARRKAEGFDWNGFMIKWEDLINRCIGCV
jgi:glycosyltransferase involved in cell wall biosynthesis